MNYSSLKKYTETEVLLFVEEARNAEMSRNVSSSGKALKPFLTNFEPADFLEEISPILRAEILRLCGFYISFYGKANRKKDFQERGRNILTNAIEIFERHDYPDKSAEARAMLALCYYYEGSLNESEAILASLEEQFAGNHLHPVYLQIRINQMMVPSFTLNATPSLKIYEDIKIAMSCCTDFRLQAMFHNQAALAFQLCGDLDKAIFHHKETIRFARRANNTFIIAANFNNLGMFYRLKRDYASAYESISESISLYEELKEFGYLLHAYDTQALILLDDNKPDEALQVIEKAIEGFSQTEDYTGWVESLWTKTLVSLRLKDKIGAVESLIALLEIARVRISEATATRYTHQFSKLIHIKKYDLSLKDQMLDFKKEVVRDAIVSTDLKIVNAAKKLSVAHQSLVEMLDTNFPDLRDELGIKSRSERSDKKPVGLIKLKSKKTGDASFTEQISPYHLSPQALVEGVEISDEIIPFFIPEYKFAQFGVCKGSVVALVKKSNYRKGAPFLIFCKETKSFDCGIADIDSLTGFFYLINEESEPIPFSKEEFFIVGEIIAFCSPSVAAKTSVITFKKWSEFSDNM